MADGLPPGNSLTFNAVLGPLIDRQPAAEAVKFLGVLVGSQTSIPDEVADDQISAGLVVLPRAFR
jgi:hypothetical protein